MTATLIALVCLYGLIGFVVGAWCYAAAYRSDWPGAWGILCGIGWPIVLLMAARESWRERRYLARNNPEN